MPRHSYSRCWIHLIWSTFKREKALHGENARRVTNCLISLAKSADIYLRSIHVNPEHVHLLIDLPATHSVDEVVKLLKGSSSRWINANRLLVGRFRWARGYAEFSVSQSAMKDVIAYIDGQDEHHRVRTFAEEYEAFARR
ncbi:IS200/IS605 family transposase [bacterium]|nr:IS200/IS605 family transposase [bacterium]